MASSNGNIFRVTGPLWGEFTGHRWIPTQRPVTRSFGVFYLIWAWIHRWVNNYEAGDFRRHRVHYDDIVMSYHCNRVRHANRTIFNLGSIPMTIFTLNSGSIENGFTLHQNVIRLLLQNCPNITAVVTYALYSSDLVVSNSFGVKLGMRTRLWDGPLVKNVEPVVSWGGLTLRGSTFREFPAVIWMISSQQWVTKNYW